MPLCTRQFLLTALSSPTAAPVSCAIRAYHAHEPQSQPQPQPLPRRTTLGPPSKRYWKARRVSPSSAIISALEDHGLHHAAPPPSQSRKVDLSHVKWKSDLDNWKHETRKFRDKSRPDWPDSIPASLTLQNIVASEIRRRFAYPRVASQKNGPASLTKQELALLNARGYSADDVDDWVCILTERHTKHAAQAVWEHGVNSQANTKKPLPLFVFSLFLRRPELSFNSAALRFALMHAWNELYRKRIAQLHMNQAGIDVKVLESCQLNYPTMTDHDVMILVIRLLRYARYVAPEALVTVASMFTQTFRLPNATESPSATIRLKQKWHTRLARLNAQYNRVLSLIALPVNAAPFLTTRYAQRALFDVLREMAKHDPPLTITREGYRAVIQVHLRSKKTEIERDWDSLKAKSWPPWKEDRTGLDAEKGPEYGVSMALSAIRHAAAAGYALGPWERVAHILSGWDLDGSPIIQTRAVLLHKYVSQQRLLRDYELMDDDASDNSRDAWVARIKATRTAQEAWACFLTCKTLTWKHEADAELPVSIYHAMLEKLAADTILPINHENEQPALLGPLSGGDMKEVLPTPISPKEATYVRTEPPTLEELANEMITRRINPNAQTIALLVSKAQSLDHGVKYLRWAALRNPTFAALLSPTPEKEKRLEKVPRSIFTAFIKLLCLKTNMQFQGNPHGFNAVTSSPRDSPLAFAQRLLQAYKPGNRMPYHVVLGRLAYHKRPAESYASRLPMSKTAIESYFVMQRIIERMHSMGITRDSGTFRIECRGLEFAIFGALDVMKNPWLQEQPNVTIPIASYPHQRTEQTPNRTPDIRFVAAEIIQTSAAKVRSLFSEVMGGAEPELHSNSSFSDIHGEVSQFGKGLPRLFATPEPVVLHYYVRVLGLLRDYAGLMALVEWMSTYREEVQAAAAEPRGGKLLLRRCFVAIRVFVERSWVADADGNGNGDAQDKPSKMGDDGLSDLAAPRQTRLKMKELIEKLGWGGWPSDDEVEAYVQVGQFPKDNA